MPNKMIIDASHPEETRVVVLRGNRVEEFDFESANKRPLRGNIYLAKVTRVEPSLQAAFVDYGGNRHGFLAFSEIHPDYYQIPVADRQALLEEEAQSQREDDDEPNGERRSRRHRRPRQPEVEERANVGEIISELAAPGDRARNTAESAPDFTNSEGETEEAATLTSAIPQDAASGAPENFVSSGETPHDPATSQSATSESAERSDFDGAESNHGATGDSEIETSAHDAQSEGAQDELRNGRETLAERENGDRTPR